MYIVYLKLNQLTKKDDVTLPRINDVLEALDEDEWFSLALIWSPGIGSCK